MSDDAIERVLAQRDPRDVPDPYARLLQRAREVAADGLPLEEALQAVRESYARAAEGI